MSVIVAVLLFLSASVLADLHCLVEAEGTNRRQRTLIELAEFAKRRTWRWASLLWMDLHPSVKEGLKK